MSYKVDLIFNFSYNVIKVFGIQFEEKNLAPTKMNEFR